MPNIITAYTLSFVILSVFALAAYLIHIVRKKQAMNVLPVIATMVTVYLLYKLIGTVGSASYYDLLALDMCIAIISTMLSILYISKPYVFVSLMVLLVAGFVIYAGTYMGNTAFAGMFAIGTIYGMLYREFVLNPKRSERAKKSRQLEINRDIVQIILGIAVLAIAIIFPYLAAISIIFALILLAYTSNNLIANLRMGRFYTRAMDLERRGATYGQGAIYLAAGTALVIGFAHNANFLLFGIVVLFFADSLATIIGVSLRHAAELPYNRNKTIVGTLAFFVVAAVGGYLILGLIGVLFAVILAFIEGLNLSLDDNIRSGIVIVILKALTGI
jgi:dolichol kinase